MLNTNYSTNSNHGNINILHLILWCLWIMYSELSSHDKDETTPNSIYVSCIHNRTPYLLSFMYCTYKSLENRGDLLFTSVTVIFTKARADLLGTPWSTAVIYKKHFKVTF